MYDNVDFRIRGDTVKGIDFLAETTQHINITGEHYFDGSLVVSGNIGNFKVSVSENGVTIKDGSLCKWHLGNNFETLTRAETKRAIERMSDTLHIPIERATISRLDIAQNFIMKHPPAVYMGHLGELKYSKRAEVADTSLYYYQSKGLLIFYDKEKEQRAKGNQIPELYTGRNTLRYEKRYKKALNKTFGVEAVTGAMLYDETFYTDIVKRWRDSYRDIKKINDVSINFTDMKGKKDLYTLGVLALAEMAGGETELLTQIAEAQKTGSLGKKQAFDIRQAVREAMSLKIGIAVQNELIAELSQKVDEASRFYR